MKSSFPLSILLTGSLLLACGTDQPTHGPEPDAGTEDSGESAEPSFQLEGEVEVLVDDRGVPHIYAETDADLLYAAGYQLATDRLFQIDLVRRRALGRGAEVLGSSKVDQDKISRLFNFKHWGALDAARLKDESPDDYALVVAWVAGINRRIDEVRRGEEPLPYGFGPEQADYQPTPWSEVDPFIVAKMIAFGNSNSLEYEFLTTVVERLSPATFESIEPLRPAVATFGVPSEDRPETDAASKARPAFMADRLPALRKAAGALKLDVAAQLSAMSNALSAFRVLGSNNWAVDGRFTENGKPLICNDPHQPLDSPSVLYAQHLNSAARGGSFDVAGFGFAGTPLVQLGHNRHIHWTATTGFADCMDLLSVEVQGDTINAGGKTVSITLRPEEIKVKGADPVTLEVRDVDGYGVLLGDALPFPEALAVDPGRSVLINWTGFRATNEVAAFIAMGRAQSLKQWEEAVDKIEVGTFNWLAADQAGISYHVHTLIPDRGSPAARQMPYLVVDGDDPGYYWTDAFLSADKLPRSRAEATGFIVTANNDPFGFTADGDVHNDPWYYGAFFDPGYRAARIEARLQDLAKDGDISVADMQALQLDTHSGMAEQLLPVLAEVYAKLPSDEALARFRDRPELSTLADLLTVDWNRTMQQDQPGALAFHAFAHFLATRVYRDDLPATFSPILDTAASTLLKFTVLTVTGQFPDSESLMTEGRDVLVMDALSDTAAWLTQAFGEVSPEAYDWGARHGTSFRNPFGGRLTGEWTPTHGGEDTVNVSGSTFYEENTTDVVDRFTSHDGAVFRIVTRFLDDGTPEAVVNFPRGNSGDPDSPHFADTLEAWREGRYAKLPFERDEIEAALDTTFTIKP